MKEKNAQGQNEGRLKKKRLIKLKEINQRILSEEIRQRISSKEINQRKLLKGDSVKIYPDSAAEIT